MRTNRDKKMRCPMCLGPIVKIETEEWVYEQCFICCEAVNNHQLPQKPRYGRQSKCAQVN
jgi:hypothetical protein